MLYALDSRLKVQVQVQAGSWCCVLGKDQARHSQCASLYPQEE